MRIKNVRAEYTGGNIYIFIGELYGGNYFIADTANYDVRILDTNPDTADEEEIFQSDWQESHLIEDLDEPECYLFLLRAMKWIRKHNPKGNYLHEDMRRYITDIKYILKENYH